MPQQPQPCRPAARCTSHNSSSHGQVQPLLLLLYVRAPLPSIMASPVSKSSAKSPASSAASPLPRRPALLLRRLLPPPLPACSRHRRPATAITAWWTMRPKRCPTRRRSGRGSDSEREGAESIDTHAAVNSWAQVMRLPSADQASEADQGKLMAWNRALFHHDGSLDEIKRLSDDPSSIPAINLTGRQLLSQQTTSEKGVLERERAFLRSLREVQDHVALFRQQQTLLKKSLAECMEKLIMYNDVKLLQRVMLRQAEQREAERVEELEDKVRRTIEGPNLAKQMEAQERKRSAATAGDRAVLAASPHTVTQ